MTDKSAIIPEDTGEPLLPSKRLMTIEQLGKYLGCSKWTIYGLVDRREIPFFPLGKRLYRFDPDKIAAWVKSRTMKTVEEI